MGVSGFRVQGSGVLGLGFRMVQGFRVYKGLGFKASETGCLGFVYQGYRVQDLGFRD